MPPQLEVRSCCCLPCRDQKNILCSSPGENLPSHNKHKPSAQFEAPLWVVSVAMEAELTDSRPGKRENDLPRTLSKHAAPTVLFRVGLWP